ncbi:MAG: RNA polymerase sigma factor region1.1 domain-containing protein, partial [Pseudomonadota bacterium]
MAPKDEDQTEAETSETPGPMLDMSQADVKKMIAKAKAKGFITYDELNRVLPSDQFSSEQIEDVMSLLSEMGVNVVEDDEETEAEDGAGKPETGKEVATKAASTAEVDRTDDPVRMYLREMGTVELLSREGEIAIAKRIEAGRATMIGGLCESPLTFQAITIWRRELLEEEILLRDVIDLETTFGKATDGDDLTEATPAADADGTPAAGAENTAEGDGNTTSEAAPDTETDGDDETDGDASQTDADDEEAQANLSLAAMEAELKPGVLERLDAIAEDYEKLRAMQTSRLDAALNQDSKFSAGQERDYQRLRNAVVEQVNALHLHNNR